MNGAASLRLTGVLLFMVVVCFAPTAPAWTDTEYSNSVLILEFDTADDPNPDTSALGSNDANLGDGVGSHKPSLDAATNGISASLFWGPSGDVADVTEDSSLYATNNFMCSIWFKMLDGDTGDMALMSRGFQSTDGGFAMWLENSVHFYVWRNGKTTYWDTTIDVNPKPHWQSVGFVLEEDETIRAYYNGVEQNSTSGFHINEPSGSPPLFLGFWLELGPIPDYNFTGNLDRVAMYTNAVSADYMSEMFWNDATNHGWSQYDYYNRTDWSNTVYVGTFSYSFPVDTSYNGWNHGTKGSGSATPDFQGDNTNGWFAFDGDDTITIPVPQAKQAYAWWGKTNGGAWTHHAEIAGVQYVNGATESFSNMYFFVSGSNVIIGQNSSHTLTGCVDELRVYTTNFNAAKLKDLYRMTKKSFGYGEQGSLVEF